MQTGMSSHSVGGDVAFYDVLSCVGVAMVVGMDDRRQGPARWDQSFLRVFGVTGCTSAYDRRNEFRRNTLLRRSDGEEAPFAGHALELMSAAVFELES
jgi:hypothetical protein